MREFVQHIADLFAAVGPVQVRRMFRGYGIFREGLMFALVYDETLYLKSDVQNVSDFLNLGLKPFEYRRRGKVAHLLSFYQAPETVMDNADEAVHWARRSFEAARRGHALKKRPARRTARSCGTDS
jgi:DNA transformation protein